jgi:hypothetical protein
MRVWWFWMNGTAMKNTHRTVEGRRMHVKMGASAFHIYGRIYLPDGKNYAMLALSEHKDISLPVLRKIEKMFKSGMVLVGKPTEERKTSHNLVRDGPRYDKLRAADAVRYLRDSGLPGPVKIQFSQMYPVRCQHPRIFEMEPGSFIIRWHTFSTCD